MNTILEVTSDTFENEVLNSTEPVLVDLYATWCPPCRAQTQVLHQIAPELAGRVKIVKINTDHEPELAGAFQVQSIPTLALLQNRKVVDVHVGLLSADGIKKMVEPYAAARPQ